VYDKFGREDSIITYWWEDPQRNETLEQAMKNNQALEKKPFKVVYQE
jgi:hypothetical protein